jgi:Tat-targeted selenate reductase subunit YnfH
MPEVPGRIWLVLSMVLGVLFVYAMSRVYQIDTVPTWHNGYTTAAFFLTVLLSGPLLAALLLHLARIPFNGGVFAFISVLALLASAAVVIMQGAELATLASSVQQASLLVPDYAVLQVWRLVLLAAGLGCWIFPLIWRREPQALSLLIGLVFVLAGELLGRGVFYGLHMTVGMAVGG